jgi:hypothetical protein
MRVLTEQEGFDPLPTVKIALLRNAKRHDHVIDALADHIIQSLDNLSLERTAVTRLQAAEAGSTEPLFAPPQVGWFIPEPNAAELHRFGYDQILLKRAEPPPLPKPEVVAQQPDASSNEMPEATLGQPEAALSQVEPVEHPPQPEPRRLADLAPAATVWRAPSGVREQRWEPPTGR